MQLGKVTVPDQTCPAPFCNSKQYSDLDGIYILLMHFNVLWTKPDVQQSKNEIGMNANTGPQRRNETGIGKRKKKQN